MPKTRLTESCNHSYQLVQDVRKFMEEAVAPVITAHNTDHSRPTRKRDLAIEQVYTRIAIWLVTFEKLNAARDVQAIGAGARCLFEHYLDLRWLEKFQDEETLNKFWAFPRVDRYLAAKKAVDHRCSNPSSKLDTTQRQRIMEQFDAKGETIAGMVSRLWGTNRDGQPRWPKGHWSGVGTLRDRAKTLGPEYEDAYVEIYPVFSTLVHSGPTPLAGDIEWIETQVGYGYFHAFRIALEATDLTIELLGIAEQIPQLEAFRSNVLQWLEEAQAAHPPN